MSLYVEVQQDATILSCLQDMEPITLEQMSSIRLMNRTDMKFVTNKSMLVQLLNAVGNLYYVQDIDGKRISNYRTVYFDTPDHHFYMIHHNGKSPRQKVRIRTYLDSDISFLEIKDKNNERIKLYTGAREVSIGDFVLTGGELPAMCIIDSVSRNIDGVLGKIDSAHFDSFSDGLLEYPQYTKPREYGGYRVPEVLLNGNHQEIALWRRKQQFIATYKKRKDLFDKFMKNCNNKVDLKLLNEVISEFK